MSPANYGRGFFYCGIHSYNFLTLAALIFFNRQKRRMQFLCQPMWIFYKNCMICQWKILCRKLPVLFMGRYLLFVVLPKIFPQ